MPAAIDVLFLVPPMNPVLRPLDVIYSFFKKVTSPSNLIPAQLGLLSMAGYLRKQGFSCQYYDLCHFKGKPTLYETISEQIKKYNPRIVALTSYTSNFNATLKSIEFIKEIDPNILVCVGGPHVTFLDRYSIDESGSKIDVVVRGEGEQVMRNIAHYFLKGLPLEENVRGITTKNKRTPDQTLLTDEELSKLPPIAFDLIPKNERNNFIYIPLTATRGCSYSCTFCTNPLFWRRKVRFTAPEKVLQDILFAEELFPNRIIEFADTILPIRMQYFEELVDQYTEMAHTPIGMALTRANLTDEKRLILMKKLLRDEGFVIIGVENGNPKILELMKKPTWETQLNALKNIKKFDIKSIPSWMVGFCGEDLNSMNLNLERIEFLNKKGLIHSVILFIWIPQPGSLPFQNPKEFGVKIHTYNWDLYDRAVFPPPYSLFDVKTGKITLSDAQIWAYYLSMVSLQNKWTKNKYMNKGRGATVNQIMKTIIKDPSCFFFTPAGESNIAKYKELFQDYQPLFNQFSYID